MSTGEADEAGNRNPVLGRIDHSPLLGFSALAVTIASHSMLWPMARLGVQVMPPLWFATARLVTASLFLFLLVAALRQLRMPTRQDLPIIITNGVFMMGIFISLSHLGMVTVESGRSALLGYSTPLWITPIAVMFLGERLGPIKASGLVIGVLGLAILFNPMGFDWSNRDVIIGNGLLLLAALTWSGCILYMRTRPYRLNTLQLAPWQLFAGSFVTITAALVMEPGQSIAWTEHNIGLIALVGPIGTSLTFWALTTTMRYLPAITSSIGFLGVPVGITVSATLLFGETLTLTHLAGLVVISGGICLVVLSEAKERP